MSFDKEYPNRKDWRKQYRRRGKYDRGCRPHGGCKYCTGSRLHKHERRKPDEHHEGDENA